MTMKICHVKIVDGKMEMPSDVLDVLPQEIELYVRTDSEKGTVIIYAKDPTTHQNQWFFDEMREEMMDVNWHVHYDDGPIPPELLGKQKSDEENNDE